MDDQIQWTGHNDMMAEEIFVRCVQKRDGVVVAKKLAKLYVLVHLQLEYKTYVKHDKNNIFLELAHCFLTHVESDLTKTDGCHAAILSILFLSDELSEII